MKRFFISALSLVLVVACSQSGDIEPQRQEVQFSATKTRAYDATWEKSDRVGVFASAASVDYTNCQYVVNPDDSSMSAVAGPEKIYVEGVQGDITYFAYYPYSPMTTKEGVYSFDLTDQSDLTEIDLLWAEPTAKSDIEVELNFKHEFAELNFEITSSTGSITEGMAKLTGSYSAGEFNLSTGEYNFTSLDPIVLPLQIAEDGKSATAKILVVPTDAKVLNYAKVVFTTASGDRHFTPADFAEITEWESGVEYNYTGIIVD